MKKILIVEDELAYLKLLNTQLSAKGHTVIEAVNGKEGLEKAIKKQPDLILLDIRMPIMDGMVMLVELRKDSWGKTAKVILLTNIEPDEKILKGVLVEQPIYYFVKSDMQLDDLMDKIADTLR